MKYIYPDAPGRNFSGSLRAELVGSTTCTAAGVTARGRAPVLTLCRQLLAAGLDPDRALEVYRGATLALRVRSIGEGALLEVSDDPPRFRAVAQPVAAPPVAQNDCPPATLPAGAAE